MKVERWIWLMCVPVLGFGAFAWYTAQRPVPERYDRPFQLRVEGVRAVAATAYDAWQGQPLAWELVLAAKGEKPAWWGKPISGRSGFSTEMPEAACRIIALENGRARPLKTNFTRWTTGWDDKIQRYTARLELGAPNVKPTDEVRWQGRIEIRESNKPPVSPTIRYDVRLKKVGEKWNIPQFSRDPKLTVRDIRINIGKKNEDEARITVFSPDGSLQLLSHQEFEDARGREIEFRDQNGYLSVFPFSSEFWHPSSRSNAQFSMNVQEGIFRWSRADLLRPPRDVFVVAIASAHDRWPLEFRFPIKRNGKILKGRVPFSSRPAPIERD